jgi:hypothetical protein
VDAILDLACSGLFCSRFHLPGGIYAEHIYSASHP